jgi:hypothetical protein
VPPNRGWFAPTDGAGADLPTQVAQDEENQRAPEEMFDPTAPLRQALWDARIATLREIDPSNLNLRHFANPGSATSQAALDRLDAALEAATIKRIMDKVMPGGAPIGQKGNDPSVQILPGGIRAAKDLFDYLRVGGRVQLENNKITVIELPGNAGYVTFRPVSDSKSPAVDIDVRGVTFDKIHFPQEVMLHDLNEIISTYVKHSEVDYVGLWQIAKAVREKLGTRTSAEVRELSLKVAKGLYEKGLRPGDYDYGTHMDFWPDEGCGAMLDRIRREWIELGADPNHLKPVCSFLLPR